MNENTQTEFEYTYLSLVSLLCPLALPSRIAIVISQSQVALKIMWYLKHKPHNASLRNR